MDAGASGLRRRPWSHKSGTTELVGCFKRRASCTAPKRIGSHHLSRGCGYCVCSRGCCRIRSALTAGGVLRPWRHLHAGGNREDLIPTLVVQQATNSACAQMAVAGPLDERDLNDELRPHRAQLRHVLRGDASAYRSAHAGDPHPFDPGARLPGCRPALSGRRVRACRRRVRGRSREHPAIRRAVQQPQCAPGRIAPDPARERRRQSGRWRFCGAPARQIPCWKPVYAKRLTQLGLARETLPLAEHAIAGPRAVGNERVKVIALQNGAVTVCAMGDLARCDARLSEAHTGLCRTDAGRLLA